MWLLRTLSYLVYTSYGKCLTRLPSYDNINIATEVIGNRITIEKYVISLIQSDGDTKDL